MTHSKTHTQHESEKKNNEKETKKGREWERKKTLKSIQFSIVWHWNEQIYLVHTKLPELFGYISKLMKRIIRLDTTKDISLNACTECFSVFFSLDSFFCSLSLSFAVFFFILCVFSISICLRIVSFLCLFILNLWIERNWNVSNRQSVGYAQTNINTHTNTHLKWKITTAKSKWNEIVRRFVFVYVWICGCVYKQKHNRLIDLDEWDESNFAFASILS